MVRRFPNSILSKLLLSTSLILLVPFLIANVYLYQMNYTERIQNARKVNEAVLEQGSSRIQEYFQSILSIPLAIYDDAELRRLLMQKEPYTDRELYLIRQAISGMLAREETLTSITVRTANGESIIQEKMDVASAQKTDLISIKQTYRNLPEKTDVAEFELTFSPKRLSLIADQMTENEQEHVTLFLTDNDTGEILYSTESILDYSMTSSETQDMGTLNEENGFFFAGEFSNSAGNYALYRFIPRKELLEPIYMLLRRLFLIQLVLFIFGVFFIYSIYRHTIRPIRRIAENIDKVREGEYAYQAAYTTEDEIGVLDKKYEEMVVTINDLINKDLKNALELSKSRLKALQAQINPHFLNNVLQSISTVALKEGARETSGYLGKLARMFRYTMDTSSDTVPVELEVQHLEDYLALQKSRFREKLEYRIGMDPSVGKLRIPKMILQPLVENAIIHGRKGGVSPLSIDVILFCPDDLHVTVTDNGGMFSDEQLEKIRREYEHYRITPDDGHGIGFLNVLYRLKLYSERFDWEVSCSPGKETRIELVLSVEEKPDESNDRG